MEEKPRVETEHAEDLPSLDASGIAEYIRFDCCPRYFKLRFDDTEEKKKKWPEAFHKPLSPLLFTAGKQLEAKTVEELKTKASDYQDFSCFDPKKEVDGWESAWRKSRAALAGIVENALCSKPNAEYKPVLVYQAPLMGHVGVWDIKGIADLIGIWPVREGKVKVRIFEIKSSWQEQTAHRIQVATYVLLLTEALGASAAQVEFEGGVINKEADLERLEPENLPSFRLEPLLEDIRRLLSRNGELYRIHCKPLPDVEYQLSWRCDNCGYNECCIVRAVENESIALLNLTRGEQKALSQYGIFHLEDLAKLKSVPRLDDLKPYNFKETPTLDAKKVQALSSDPVVGSKLERLIQRAQFMLATIRPTSPYGNRVRLMPWLTGTGYGTLPEDSPYEGSDTALSFKPNGMIRVYFHIQWDYLLNIISMISARVNCTRYHGEPVTLSRIVDVLPKEQKEAIEEERKLLDTFFSELTKAINRVAVEVGSPDEAPIHLYFYSRQERDHLMDAVRRHSLYMVTAHAVQDLLGLRQAIDQPMFSILQDEIMLRKAVGYHSTGLLPVLKQCCYFDPKQWTVKRSDGSTLDLRRAFRDGFFNFELPYARTSSGSISFILGSEDLRLKEAYYPARARFGNQIPIEYIWGAKGRLDSTQIENGHERVMVEKRLWIDYPDRTRRISDEDLKLLSQQLCLALETIERSLNIRNRRLGKKPIPIPQIPQFTLGRATLERSCREFLDLEYFARRQELYQHYALLPSQRVATGRSLIFECLSVEETEQDFTVRGKLVYESLGLPKSECTVNACRVKGSDDSGSGDWMIATEIRRNTEGQFEEAHRRAPSEVEKSARVIVEKVDLRKMELTIKAVNWPSARVRRYSTWHNLPTADRDKAENSKHVQLFEVGRTYILDELADDIISERAAACLDYAANNELYCLLEAFLAGKSKPSDRKALSKDAAAKFTVWALKAKFPPTAEQNCFINRVFGSEQVVMLQGPPGTGKTETLQLAVLTHVAAHRVTGRCHVLMVAPTHKAIHEFVSKLAKTWRSYCKSGSNDLAKLRIYRVVNNVSSVKAVEGVKYVNYNEDEEAVAELRDALSSQGKLVSDASDNFPLILCVTPPGLYGLMKKIGGKEPQWNQGYFDLLVVDEASMMRLPELILSGAFIDKTAQILVAGDHRQLPPIQVHNWEKEDRRTIEEMASFLSAMDFLRLLRQEDLGLEHVKFPSKADIPAERLRETHRCHQVVARFLKEWVYHKDGIDFQSNQTQTLTSVKPATEGLKVVLDPENVFVLVLHDEAESFQSNVVEARIINALVRSVPAETVGVVTPHNAQRGVVKNLLWDGYENLRVDTVERYQGGEADFIIISSTVSDPDYVRIESDFLLNLNRVNVAISRMKKKLVIVASRSIFEFMPQDAKDYDKALLWKGIAQTVGFTANSTPKWQGTLTDFLGKASQTVKIQVYAKSSNS